MREGRGEGKKRKERKGRKREGRKFRVTPPTY